MSQSSILFGGLFLGFIVYVTLKGQLPAYEGVLWGPVPQTTSSGAVQSSQQAQATAASVNNVFGSSLGANAPATAQNIVTGRADDQIGTTITSAWNWLQSANTWVENQGWGN